MRVRRPPRRGLISTLLDEGCRACGTCLLLAWCLLLAGCADGEAGSQKSCSLEPIAELRLLPDPGHLVMAASLGGQKVGLLLDTGAAISVIGRDSAQRFGLRAGSDRRFVWLVGVGGPTAAMLVDVRGLELGRGVAHDLELPVAGKFGRSVGGVPIIGVFGADFLSNYDVDIDVPARHVAIWRLHRCGSQIHPPFAAPSFDLPFELDDTRITFDVKLDGRTVPAFLDTGAFKTLVTPADAAAAGADAAALAADPPARAVGIDGRLVAARLHRFASLEVGDEILHNAPLLVAGTSSAELVLGADWLRFNRVWISYPLGRLFIQPVVPAAARAMPGASPGK